MSNNGGNKEAIALIGALIVSLGLAGGGFWFLFMRSDSPTITTGTTGTPDTSTTPTAPGDNPLAQVTANQPNQPIVAMDGSVTMVRVVKQLRNAFSQRNPSIATTYGIPDGRPNGSNKGLQALRNAQVAIAATSRPLKAEDVAAGLVAIPIARDSLAIVVGRQNSFAGSLTMDQLRGIFTGRITNWKEVGGEDRPIKVWNRANASGTQELFKDVVLEGQNFPPNNANYVTWPQDQTTPILQRLGSDGISYTTVFQAVGQQTVKTVPIDGISPADRQSILDGRYPITRFLFLATPKDTSPNAKAFIEFVLSEEGQQVVEGAGFIRLN
ncbi:MAG: phosphate ABC transporter substrate-binding protein [Oscillatoriales cyanobacterium SM2_2_1]|nr:phosphate ABC transporter substrate-binding protein [Oscillatoriales cyanobacterium SM2_2_1]